MSDLEELDRKYDKIIDFLVEQRSIIKEFIKNQGKIDKRLRKIEDKFTL